MKLFLSLLITVSVLLLSSCSFFEASSGQGTTYQYGTMEGYFEAPLDKVHTVCEKAIKNLELTKVNSTKDAIFSTYEVKNAKDDTIKISFERIADRTTKIKIKVGLLGDKVYSQAIYDNIKKLL